MPPADALAILRVLVEHIRSGSVRPEDPSTFLGYAQVHERLNLTMVADTIGNSLKRQCLQAVAEWLERERLPAVDGLVVSLSSSQPGPGYYEVHGRRDADIPWWLGEIRNALAHDWSRWV